jgi:hypothetical protein
MLTFLRTGLVSTCSSLPRIFVDCDDIIVGLARAAIKFWIAAVLARACPSGFIKERSHARIVLAIKKNRPLYPKHSWEGKSKCFSVRVASKS